MTTKLVMELVNDPVEVAAPSSVWSPEVVGLTDVLQQTPWAVGFGFPKSVIFPFPVTAVVTISLTAWVVTVGTSASCLT